MMTFGSHLCATIFKAEHSLAMNACWFKRSIPFFLGGCLSEPLLHLKFIFQLVFSLTLKIPKVCDPTLVTLL